VNPLHNAEIVMSLIEDWIEDYNENHTHSGLKWKSPREFRGGPGFSTSFLPQ